MFVVVAGIILGWAGENEGLDTSAMAIGREVGGSGK